MGLVSFHSVVPDGTLDTGGVGCPSTACWARISRPMRDSKDGGGTLAKPKLGDKVVAAIKWVDGTVIDCVRAVGA